MWNTPEFTYMSFLWWQSKVHKQDQVLYELSEPHVTVNWDTLASQKRAHGWHTLLWTQRREWVDISDIATTFYHEREAKLLL